MRVTYVYGPHGSWFLDARQMGNWQKWCCDSIVLQNVLFDDVLSNVMV
jgi:hypothetical protein